jgi:hypothetical protein
MLPSRLRLTLYGILLGLREDAAATRTTREHHPILRQSAGLICKKHGELPEVLCYV